MKCLTIRSVPDEVHRALRVQAALHGRSAEAEIRNILENAVKPERRVGLGSVLADIGREARLSDEEFTALENVRDRQPTRSLDLE